MRHLKPLVLAAFAAAVLALPATASAGVVVKSVDATSYPTLRATVVSSAGARSFVRAKCAGDEGSVVAFGYGAYSLSRPSTLAISMRSPLPYRR